MQSHPLKFIPALACQVVVDPRADDGESASVGNWPRSALCSPIGCPDVPAIGSLAAGCRRSSSTPGRERGDWGLAMRWHDGRAEFCNMPNGFHGIA